MKKITFNFKLTVFLVSLFVALLLIILGGKNNVCLCFGFIVLGLSLGAFSWCLTEKTQKVLMEIDEQIAEIGLNESQDENVKDFMIMELSDEQKKIKKRNKRTWILFTLTGALIALLGFLNLFV